MHTSDEYLHIVLPYRMRAIDAFWVALRYVLHWDKPKKMELFFDGELCVRGLSTGWTNPVIESGIMHCRACLEFLGLRENPKHPLTLSRRKSKRLDDFGIEDFDQPLLTIEDAVRPYGGPPEEAERALACVIHCANKGVAHTTAGQIVVEDDLQLYEIAARGVPTLLINHLYVPLGIEPPEYKTKSTARNKST